MVNGHHALASVSLAGLTLLKFPLRKLMNATMASCHRLINLKGTPIQLGMTDINYPYFVGALEQALKTVAYKLTRDGLISRENTEKVQQILEDVASKCEEDAREYARAINKTYNSIVNAA
jgi:hypothetical protein